MTPRLSQELQDIIDRQPEGRRPRSWFRDNWMAFVMLVAWGLGQAAAAGGWIGSKQANETNLAAEISKLREDLNNANRTYVRQDVFDAVLRRIDDNLRSLNEQKRQRTGGD